MNNNQIAKNNDFITRQTLASWESGISTPQENKIKMLKEQGVNVDRFILPVFNKFSKYLSTPIKTIPNPKAENKVYKENK